MTNIKKLIICFVLVFCIITPAQAVNLNDNIHFSDDVSISVTKATKDDYEPENNISPLSKAVLAIIMTVIIIYFLNYLRISDGEIPIRTPVKTPVENTSVMNHHASLF